jgi:HEAT repeat protein/beta-lactamase regulating signal transducer with metallopeptidase domain
MLDPILKVTVLLALVTMAAHLLRKHSAALRHMVWTFGIIAMVLIPLLASTVPFKLRVIPASTVSIMPTERTLPPPISADTKDKAPIAKSDAPSVSATSTPTPAVETSGAPLDLGRTLLLVWALGVAYLALRYTIGVIRVRGIARRSTTVTDEAWLQIADRAGRLLGVREPVDIRRSDEVAMPFACGLKNPVIVLPAVADEWTIERREAVMMHEFAHISRGDLAMNMLSHAARALYWFHPLAWLASYRLRVEGERACDDAVLRAGALPSDYAEHLLSIVRSVGNTVPNVALAMARRSDFEGRLLAILEPGVPRGTLTRLRATALAGLFVVAVMPLSAMAPTVPTPMVEAQTELSEVRGETKTRTLETSKTTKSVTMQSVTTSQSSSGKPEQQTGNAAVNALIETLSDAHPGVRLAAIESLGQLQDPRAITALSRALKEDTDPRVREAAAHSLGEIDDSRAVPALLEALRAEKAPNVKVQIVKALGEIDDPSAVQGIAAVVKDPSIQVRRAAAWALGEIEDPSAVPALTSMVRDEDAEVRKYVASALSDIENANAFDALTILAKDVDAEVRQHAIDGLGNMEDMRTLPTLLAALRDENAEVRQQAADGIGDLDNLRTAPPALIEALRDTDKDVRQQVASALGNIGDAAAVPALKRAVADSDLDVRRQVVEALKDIGGVEAMEALVALLKDSDPEIRKTAAEALGKKHE